MISNIVRDIKSVKRGAHKHVRADRGWLAPQYTYLSNLWADLAGIWCVIMVGAIPTWHTPYRYPRLRERTCNGYSHISGTAGRIELELGMRIRLRLHITYIYSPYIHLSTPGRAFTQASAHVLHHYVTSWSMIPKQFSCVKMTSNLTDLLLPTMWTYFKPWKMSLPMSFIRGRESSS